MGHPHSGNANETKSLSRVGQPPRPDRATAGTDGIDNGGQVGSGFRLQRVGVRRGVAKVGRKWRNFGGAGAESRTIGALQMKLFHIDANRDWGDNDICFWGQKGNSG
jgi:hypothetical protein